MITVASVGVSATTDISGGDDGDTVRVAIAHLPTSATTTLHGGNPTAAPGDTLIIDPQDPLVVITSNGVAGGAITFPSGNVNVAGRGLAVYDTFEGYQVLSGPIIAFEQVTQPVAEGNGLTLVVSVQPLGSTNTLAGDILFDIDGNGLFGDVVGTDIGGDQYRVIIPWERLVDFGLNDGTSGASFTIAARATNGDGYSSTALATVQLNDTPPTVTVSGASHATNVGDPYTIDFTAADYSPIDRVLQWTVNWGDGTTEIFGAGTTGATHSYAQPGTVGIIVSTLDKDATAFSAPWTVVIGAPDPLIGIDPGEPYVIAEGQSLTLNGSAIGTPSGFAWDLNNDGTTDATGATATLTWAQLVALGIADDGTYSAPVLKVSYTPVGGGTPVVATRSFTVDVTNAAPIFTSFTNNGPVDEGSTATVTFAGASDPSPVDAVDLRYRFDFDNDGTFDTALGASASVLVPVSYLGQSGQLTVRGQVVDPNGATADGFTTITINEVAPTLTVIGAASTTEGSVYTLGLSATDPGADVIKWWDVDWGDGTVEHVVIDPTALNGNATANHSYVDNGAYAIAVTATDNDGTYAAPDTPVTVTNVAPTTSNVAVTSADGTMAATIDENGFARLSGEIADPGTLDSFSLAVDWGDGSAVETYALPAGTQVFDVSHQYLQDGTYQIVSAVTDKDGGSSATTTLSLQVNNVAPVADSLSVSPAAAGEGSAVTVSGSYSDVGSLDSHTVSIDWGDGSTSQSTDPGTTIVVDAVNRTFTATHVYADNPDLTLNPASIW